MDADRFDSLARSLPGVRSRRGALAAMVGGVIAPLAGLTDGAAKKKGKGGGKNKKKRKNESCKSDLDCKGSEVCEGQCRPGCRSWAMCDEDQGCNLVTYQCATECGPNLECPDPEVCHGEVANSWCAADCITDADCPKVAENGYYWSSREIEPHALVGGRVIHVCLEIWGG